MSGEDELPKITPRDIFGDDTGKSFCRFSKDPQSITLGILNGGDLQYAPVLIWSFGQAEKKDDIRMSTFAHDPPFSLEILVYLHRPVRSARLLRQSRLPLETYIVLGRREDLLDGYVYAEVGACKFDNQLD